MTDVTYRIDIIDLAGRHAAQLDRVPLLEAVRRSPDRSDRVAGMLPPELAALGPGYRLRVFVDDRLFCEAPVVEVAPRWSDTRKLILDRYVRFHELLEVLAETEPARGNVRVSRAFTEQAIGTIVRDLLNEALGPVHYTVAHDAFPDGAQREYAKFIARKSSANELSVGGITSGQWVGGARINAAGAYAKDGDTVAGLVVDGVAWPDLRLMMIDAEETSRNAHAIARHPEVADWSDAQYNASIYKLRADAAKQSLEMLLVTQGIDYIELNPHRDASGAFDDRVDAFGRYIGVAYGGGLCFNAAQVELGHADVYLYEDGRYHDPAMALKEFYSYTAAHTDSVEDAATSLIAFDTAGGVYETVTALAYAAGGYVFSVDPRLAVRFYRATRPARVWWFDPVRMGVAFGSDETGLANLVHIDGNPISGAVSKSYTRGESIDVYGLQSRSLRMHGLSREEDADKFAAGLLDDVAYPLRTGELEFFYGNADVEVGDLIELRGAPLRRIDPELPGEYGGRFSGRLVARVREVAHRFSGEHVSTRVLLTSPLRSVDDPTAFMVRGQLSGSALFQFRLDDAGVGLDGVHHLD